MKEDRTMVKLSLIVSTLGVLLLGSTVPAGAGGHEERSPGRPAAPPPGGPGPRGGPSGALLERLIFPCRAACLDAGRTCGDTADATAVTCTERTCATAVETARTACGADPTTEECQDARSALRACAQPCLTARRDAAGACRTTVDECLDACDATAAQ
jgi:hypothetical protein